jgi:hypothetical protein
MISKINLANYRTEGDQPADELINKLNQTEGITFLRQIIPFLSDFQQLSFDAQPKIVQDFLRENAKLPASFNKKHLIRATDFYKENQQNIGLVLGLYSLPYCYLGADGAKVLYLSERIKNDTSKRLFETGAFLKAAMDYTHWTNNNIYAICLKIRLLHAIIRHFTLKSDRWDLAWGYPINQEDMLGTNLAFSIIVMRGLNKIGHSIDPAQETAYLATWNTIGYLLGVKTEILPANYLAAVKIDKQIAERQFRQSKEGEELTASLMKTIRAFAPNDEIGDLLQEQSRFLLGEKYAKMLAIKETNMPKTLLKIYNNTSVLMSKFF